MKKTLILSILLLAALLSNSQNLLHEPQKIVIDVERNRFIVSNFGSLGDLILIDSLGNQDTLVINAGMNDGMQIVGDTVYGSGSGFNGRILGYDLNSGNKVMDTNILGVQHLSSFIVDSLGILYTSERFGNRIFKINPKTQEYWVFAQDIDLDEPNGMLLEPENDRMLVCLDQIPPKILSVSLSDSSVTILATLNINGSDGIDKDLEGNYYITGYYLPGMYKFNSDFSGEPELFYVHDHMVYPTYNEKNNSFLVTLYADDDWAEIPIDENVLNNPESIVYDEKHDRYIVSNCGDGKIIQIDNLGQQSFFNTALSYTLGLHIAEDSVFVSTNDGALKGVAGMSLTTRGIRFHTEIPEQQLLNDITSDTLGNLYITDCDANKIYKVNIENSTYSTFVNSGLGYPNGILFDAPNNRLLVANDLLPDRPLSAIDLEDATVTTVVETGINSIDGLTTDNYGCTYFSSWDTDKVYRYDESFTNPPEIVSEGHTDPADIFYNKQDTILAVPNYTSNIVEFIPIIISGTRDEKKSKIKLISLYPNPFYNEINIDFYLPEKASTKITVFDILGNRITELINEELNNGEHSVRWNGENNSGKQVPNGTYFFRLTVDGLSKTQRGILAN